MNHVEASHLSQHVTPAPRPELLNVQVSKQEGVLLFYVYIFSPNLECMIALYRKSADVYRYKEKSESVTKDNSRIHTWT